MPLRFTDRQLDVMNILWDRGSVTVREAKERMEDDLAYTGVLTVFQTLEKNGHVRYETEGKAYRYFPTVSRKEAGREAVVYVLGRIYQGSGSAMAETLLKEANFTEAEIQSILNTLSARPVVVGPSPSRESDRRAGRHGDEAGVRGG